MRYQVSISVIDEIFLGLYFVCLRTSNRSSVGEIDKRKNTLLHSTFKLWFSWIFIWFHQEKGILGPNIQFQE